MQRLFWAILVLAGLGAICLRASWFLAEAGNRLHHSQTIEQRLQQYGETVEARLKPYFARAGVSYPPGQVTIVVLKQERRLELYAANPAVAKEKDYRFIRSYPVLAASGHLGPKLSEGDGQVPEGIYPVASLNPNSRYHLALHVGYPNAFDRVEAKIDGRADLGGDIMIHGGHASVGGVALGDPAAEDLFILAAQTGLPNVRLLFCPYDFRLVKKAPAGPDLPAWTPILYANLEQNLAALPRPPLKNETSP